MFEGSPQVSVVDLNRWDVGTVQTMKSMFHESAFNGQIDQWNVRNVKSMDYMFAYNSFNGNVSGWNTESLESLQGVFGSSSYKGDLTSWNTSRVVDFSLAFTYSSFNGDVSGWDVSNGRKFESTFGLTDSFDGDLSKWDMGNAVDCTGMVCFDKLIVSLRVILIFVLFQFAKSKMFTGIGIGNWNVSNLAVAKEMFAEADKFQEDVSTWKVAKLQDATRMFASAASFNHSLCAWSDSLPEPTKVVEMFKNSGCMDQTTPNLLPMNDTSLCWTCAIR
jgi:Mycoplasma protein of unknown function, DUF285